MLIVGHSNHLPDGSVAQPPNIAWSNALSSRGQALVQIDLLLRAGRDRPHRERWRQHIGPPRRYWLSDEAPSAGPRIWPARCERTPHSSTNPRHDTQGHDEGRHHRKDTRNTVA